MMKPLDRRQFLLLGACFAAGCVAPETVPSAPVVVDAGPADQYLADGVYGRFRARGFFLVRQGARLFALSSYCTHRHCRLDAERDGTFTCPCHGSAFDAQGQVTEGPAKRPLPVFSVSRSEQGHVLVTLKAG
jgi:Rieske Fe-S protein